MKTLDDYLPNRNNNLTPLRLFLSWMVLYGHSFPITGRLIEYPRSPDHISRLFDHTWVGAVAVELFFALSGMLVAKSYVDRGAWQYIISRVLRIYPALIVCVLLSVFILGPMMTSLSLAEYFHDTKTYDYLKNMTLVAKVRWNLPGVEFNGQTLAMNGSLWTLPVEARCYVLLVVLGILGVFSNRFVVTLLAGSILLIGFVEPNLIPLVGDNKNWLRPSAYFLVGVTAYKWAEHIPITWPLAGLAAVMVVIANGSEHWHLISAIPMIYIALTLAYRTPHLDMDKKFGDISYGTYIYAWPIQVAVVIVLGITHTYAHMLVSTILTFALAYASWRFIEKPALGLKKKWLTRGDKRIAKVAV